FDAVALRAPVVRARAVGVRRRFVATALLAGAALFGALPTAAGAATRVARTFSAVGAHQFVVPVGVTEISVDVFGAQGGLNSACCAEALATLAVAPDDALTVVVGGRGGDAPLGTCGVGAGGFNGGGAGGRACNALGSQQGGSGGGGASEVRRGMTALVVAGGGGGKGVGSVLTSGGGAGGQSGTDADDNSWLTGVTGGTGATPITFGTKGLGSSFSMDGADGSAGQGGRGGDSFCAGAVTCYAGGGGGGGVFGGG